SPGRLAATVRNVVFVNDVARQPAMFGHGESLPLGPSTYLAAPLSASCRSDPDARPLRAHQAGMIHEWSELAAELDGMPGAQVYLVVHAFHAELHSLVGGAASEVVLQMYFHPLHYISPQLRITFGSRPKGELAVRVIPCPEQMYRGLCRVLVSRPWRGPAQAAESCVRHVRMSARMA